MEQDAIYGLLCAVLLLVTAAFLYLYINHKKMCKAVVYLTEKAEQIAAGEYDELELREGTPETKRLAKAVGKMNKRLRIEQERVLSRKEELNSILTSMNNGIMAMDSDGKILFYNQSFAKMIPVKSREQQEELLGHSFYDYFKNPDVEEVIRLVEEEEKIVKKETVLEQGEEKTILLIRGTPLYKKSKRKVGTLLNIEDVTRVKKLETMRKDFVSNVTHELKTPLTSIRGFVDTLKAGAVEDPKVAERFLDIIDIEAERLNILVNDILILSEIESGNPSAKSMVNVEEVIDSVVALLEEKKKDKVRVVKEMEKPVTDFLCNRHWLKEMILNLADNGVKYTNEGTVTIKCWEEETDLVFQFIDTGVGIPKEHLPRLFERFYRVDKGRSRKQGGTGLGLSIVKHIVELYRGTISVESEPGEGSVFTVRLPYYE